MSIAASKIHMPEIIPDNIKGITIKLRKQSFINKKRFENPKKKALRAPNVRTLWNHISYEQANFEKIIYTVSSPTEGTRPKAILKKVPLPFHGFLKGN